MKLSVHLVTWNGEKYISSLFDSLKKQTFKDWRLVILDNASSDDTIEKIKMEFQDFSFGHELIVNSENKGFAGGHNQLFKLAIHNEQLTSEYVLLLNQDMYLMPDCLEKSVRFMDEHPESAAASSRLMWWNHESLNTNTYESVEKSFTDRIDSLGLKVLRNRRAVELHTGELWSICKLAHLPARQCQALAGGQTCASEVFGVSGALPMYRVEALDYIKFSDGSIFDESYHSYKEDVDLAYRLRSAGYKSHVVLDAVAYHDRSAAGPKDLKDSTALQNKKKQSEWVKYHSYKNHLMTLYKNEYWQNFLLDFPWILWYEVKKLMYFVLFDRGMLKGLWEIWRMRKGLRDKRYEIKNKRKVDWRNMREKLTKY